MGLLMGNVDYSLTDGLIQSDEHIFQAPPTVVML